MTQSVDPLQENVQQRRDRVLEALQGGESAAARQRQAEIQSLVDQIVETRKNINTKVVQLSGLCDQLQRLVRRNPDEASASYVLYANSHIRMASALNNGIRRTASMDRMLDRAAQEREETKRYEERERARAEAREREQKREASLLPTADDFDEVYGEVTDA